MMFHPPNKVYSIRIENPSTPCEVLFNVVLKSVSEETAKKISEEYTGNERLEYSENGLEFKRYGRIVLQEIKGE